MTRKTTPLSISFQPDVYDFLEKKTNKSEIVNQAIREYRKTRTTPELKIKQLKEQKRELLIKINQLDDEIKDLK